MWNKILKGFCITVLYMTSIYAKTGFVITSVECKCFAPHVFRYFDCQLKQDMEKEFLFLNFQFKRIISNMIADLSLTGGRFPFYNSVDLLKVRLNVCEYFSKVQGNTLLSGLVAQIRRTMNEMPTCPFKANFNYTIAELSFRDQDMHVLMLMENYTLAINYFLDDAKLAHFLLKGSFPNQLSPRAKKRLHKNV